MSGLFGSLASGLQAVNAQAKALEVTSKNLANVNNPDYARQRVQFGDRGTIRTAQGPQSLGIEAVGISSLRDRLMDSQVVREVGLTGALEAETRALQQAEAIIGERIDSTDATTGLGLRDSLDALFGAFYEVANSPTDAGGRQSLLSQAGILADRLNVTDERLAALQTGLDDAVETDLAAANGLLETIAELNGQISRFEVDRPGGAVDLRDQRTAALEKLGNYMRFETRDSAAEPGQIDVIARAADGSEVSLVDLAVVTGPLSFDGASVAAGDPPVGLSLQAGRLKGHLSARDGAIADLRRNLNDLSGQLVTSVNALYNPDGSGPDFFDPAGTTAGTIRLADGLTPATLLTSHSGISGDNALMTALGDLAMETFSTASGDAIDGTFMDAYAATISQLGNDVAGAESRLVDQENIETLVRTQRDSISAVSLDEEMVNLVKYQRAFEASSRVVQMIDEMLDVIVNRIGA